VWCDAVHYVNAHWKQSVSIVLWRFEGNNKRFVGRFRPKPLCTCLGGPECRRKSSCNRYHPCSLMMLCNVDHLERRMVGHSTSDVLLA